MLQTLFICVNLVTSYIIKCSWCCCSVLVVVCRVSPKQNMHLTVPSYPWVADLHADHLEWIHQRRRQRPHHRHPRHRLGHYRRHVAHWCALRAMPPRDASRWDARSRWSRRCSRSSLRCHPWTWTCLICTPHSPAVHRNHCICCLQVRKLVSGNYPLKSPFSLFTYLPQWSLLRP